MAMHARHLALEMKVRLAARRSLLPPPLWGRGGEGGGRELTHSWVPPSLSLPHKGGGNAGAAASDSWEATAAP